MAVDDPGLREQRDFLLRSLDDLDREREAGDVDEADYIELRDAYTAQAADVLRAIDGADASDASGPSSRSAPASRRRHVRWTAITVVAVLAFGAIAGVLVAASSGTRVPGQRRAATAAGDSRLAQAHELMGQGKALEAIKLFDAVLRDDPRNVDALTYRGWLLQLAGLSDPALESLDKALAVDPAYADAHFFRGMTLYQGKHDPAAAVPEFRAFLAANPTGDLVPMVQQVLDRAIKEAGQAP